MTRPGQQNGFILMPVVLAIALIATLAFLLNNQSAINVTESGNMLEAEQAEQLARAGLAHAVWSAQSSDCTGNVSMASLPFGQGSYSATVTTPSIASNSYSLPADQDAWFRSDDITKNNGVDVRSHLRLESGNREYAVVRFDLSSLAAGAQINSATARFYVRALKGHPAGPVQIHRVTTDWTEAGATWETMATNYDSVMLNTILPQPLAGDAWVSVNLTAQVQAWVNGGEPNYGIMLIPPGEGTHAEYISREGVASQQPRLDVIVGNGAASPMNISVTGTLSGNPGPANDISRSLTRTNVPVYQPPAYALLQLQAGSGKDATLSGFSNSSNFGGDSLRVSLASGSPGNALVQFDVAEIPVGARVVSAQLQLYHTLTVAAGSDAGATVHQVNRDWLEGTQTGSGVADGVTWDTRDGSTDWTTDGGDYDLSAVTGSAITAATDDWESWDITMLVQGWVDGSYPNNGLLLKGSGSLDVSFASKENADPALHPKLSISYACECGSTCLAPLGSGKVLLAVKNPNDMLPVNVAKKALFESWGYTVALLSENASQGAIDTAVSSNDVVYVSNTASSNHLGTRLAGVAIGVISEDGDYNADFGTSSSSSYSVAKDMDVIDSSHYITALFPAGMLPIYSANMENLLAAGTLATDLQILGSDPYGGPSLAVVETGGLLADGSSTAAGRRVVLPIGRNGNFNWDYLNASGRLMVQRALQWGTGNTGSAPSGPAAHWKLDDGSGLTAVDSVGGHDGALINGPAWSAGQIDGALNFNGSSDYINVPHADTLSLTDTMTFTAWVNASSYGGAYQAIVAKDGSGTGSNYYFGSRQQELVFGFFSAGVFREVFSSGLNLQAGTWYQLAASFDNAIDEVRLYVDGVQVQSGTLAFSPTAVTADLSIGRSPDGEYWPGLLDDIRLYDSVLPASEIADLYAIGSGGGGGTTPTAGAVFEAFTESALGSDGSSLSISKPAGTVAGDLLVAAVATDGNNTGSLLPPAGWNVVHVADSTGKVTFGVWWKVAGASESSSYTFSWSNSERAYGWIMRFTGFDPSSPINVTSNAAAISAAPPSPSVVTTVANALILRLAGFDNNSVTVGLPGLPGHTVINMNASDGGNFSASGGSAYSQQAVAGDSGVSSFDLSKNEKYVTVTIAITPAP